MGPATAMSYVTIFGITWNIYAILLTLFFAIFLFALYRAQKSERLDWLDMLTQDGRKVSATKILQLVGGVVGTWIITQVTLQGQLTWDIFAIYLAYVASIDGFSNLLLAKYGAESTRGGGGRRGPGPPTRRRTTSYETYEEEVPPSTKETAQKPPDFDDLKY